MKHKNPKVLLIGLLVLSILISVSAINATDDTNSTNTIKTVDNTKNMISTQENNDNTKTIEKQEKSIKSTVKENKNNNTKNEKTTKKIVKKESYNVESYQQLYEKIEQIKTTSTNNEETINLNPGNYNITNTINWGNTAHTKTLTIKGNNITLDGQGQHQFIQIANDYTLNLENITIQKCNSEDGAVINNRGNVTIKDSNFNNNNGNFGGVNDNAGNMNITNSTFNNNTARESGVNENDGGNMTITNSTFNNNTADISSGVNNNNGNMNIINSTFNNNTAGAYGGVNYNNGNMTITNSTFNNNTADISSGVNYNFGNMNITDSIFLSDYDTCEIYNDRGSCVLNNITIIKENKKAQVGNNTTLISPIKDTSLSSDANIIFKTSTDTYTAQKNEDNEVKTEVIFKKAGEETVEIEYPNIPESTIKLVYNVSKSEIENITLPTIQNKVFKNTTLNITINDKQGNPLVGNISAEIKIDDETLKNITIENGAINTNIETDKLTGGNYTISIIIPESTYYNEGTINQILTINEKDEYTVNNYQELYEIINNIKILTQTPAVTINLNPGDYNITNTINWGNITHTTKTLTIKGNNITLDGQEQYQFITIAEDYTLNLENITIQKCNSQEGAVIYNNGNVTIKDSEFNNNTAGNGGVNYNNRGNIDITDSNFNNNTANRGGVNYNSNGNMNITNSNFTSNNAVDISGVNYNEGNMTITNSTFNNNTARHSGAIYNDINGNLSINKVFFYNNFDTSNITISSHGLLVMRNILISNDYGSILVESDINFRSPIENTVMSYEEVVKFKTSTDDIYNITRNNNFVETIGIFTKTGNQTVNIEYPSYNDENNTIKLNYNILRKTIENQTLPEMNMKVFNNLNTIGVIKDTNGNIITKELNAIVTINGTQYKVIIENGLLDVIIPTEDLPAGKYDAIIDIPETETTTQAQIKQTININKRDILNVTLEDATIQTQNNHTILVVIKDTNGNIVKSNLPVAVKINGKTQQHIKINDGILNVTLKTDDFRNPNYNITVIIGSNDFYNGGIIIQKLNIIKRDANITIKTNTLQTLGNLNAEIKVTDGNYLVDGGFVIFKINGKTLEDENGEIIKVNVVNGYAYLNYSIPSSIGSGNYNITCVYNNPYYNRASNTENFTIVKSDMADITLDKIHVLKGKNTTINILLNDKDGNQIRGTQPVAIKINGKTQQHIKIEDGILDTTLTTDDFKNSNYTVTIIIGENSLYNKEEITTILIIEDPLKENATQIESTNTGKELKTMDKQQENTKIIKEQTIKSDKIKEIG